MKRSSKLACLSLIAALTGVASTATPASALVHRTWCTAGGSAIVDVTASGTRSITVNRSVSSLGYVGLPQIRMLEFGNIAKAGEMFGEAWHVVPIVDGDSVARLIVAANPGQRTDISIVSSSGRLIEFTCRGV
jgi:hypothetical protein